MNESKISAPKRKIVAIAAAAAAFAAVTVSAATLGGLQTDSVGANSNEVVSPVTKGVALSWKTEYNATARGYVVAGVNLAPISDAEEIPAGATVNLTLLGAQGKPLGEYRSTNGAGEWTAPAGVITAHDVQGASVVINGGKVSTVVSDNN